MLCTKTTMLYYGLCLLLICVDAAFEGESCTKDGVAGRCISIENCQAAQDDLRRRKNPQICGFTDTVPIVCCIGSGGAPTTSPRPVLTTSTKRTKTTTEYNPPVYDYKVVGEDNNEECEKIPTEKTSPKTGPKAFIKCIEYQEKYVYPCVRSVTFVEDRARAERCGHNADQLILDGEDAAAGEFPHMVLLGYGDVPQTARWLCGGSIVSDKFILTAGHCTSARDVGPVAFARIGALKRSERLNLNYVYELKKIWKHPEYKSPHKYNDIALLETKNVMRLDQFSVPACLHVGDVVKDSKALATGWGLTTNGGNNADTLQKVLLKKFTSEECDESFPASRHMLRGYDPTTQICYGDKQSSKDTCQGDSGGPLQINSLRVHCMYVIVGVTSFGKECGYPGQPGMYTRVAPYLPWIESLVWPN